MPEREKPQGVDELIESLLAEYSDVGPRPGMETRLLASLRAESVSPPTARPFWRWIPAAAAALAVSAAVCAIYVLLITPLPAPPNIRAAGPPVLPSATLHVRLNGPERPVPIRREERLAASAEHVRQEVFPTPGPLSDQERLLFRYLAEVPKEQVVALSKSEEPVEGTGSFGPQPQQFVQPEGQSIR